LEEGFVACAIVDDEIVAIAHTSARTDKYADIGVFTSEEWRRRGFVTAAASIVAKCIQDAGLTPTWSAGEDNFASLRVAQKLGFIEASRRTYVIKKD
jgi:predicted GNAT family acetyltransferase